MFLESTDYSCVYNEPEVHGACMINNLLSPVALTAAVRIVFALTLRLAAINGSARLPYYILCFQKKINCYQFLFALIKLSSIQYQSHISEIKKSDHRVSLLQTQSRR